MKLFIDDTLINLNEKRKLISEFCAYCADNLPIENDFDRFETVGPFSSRDECTAKAQEMNAAAYSCDPKAN